MKKILLTLALCACGLAFAEKADLNKKIEVTAVSVFADDVTQVRTLTGDVQLTRGTLIMKAGKATVRTDAEGYMFAVFTADPAGLATFRQKADGGDFWIEGQAERIEYDNKQEVVKLFSKAKLVRLEGSKTTQEFEGAFVSYDSRKENFTGENSPTGESKVGGGRVKIVIEPSARNKAAAVKQ
ncbi:MAG: lipopolysaccharide transport periplasmic protein LptA [Pseudomonadota bacterium]